MIDYIIRALSLEVVETVLSCYQRTSSHPDQIQTMSTNPNGKTISHYKDWPNTLGFDAHYEERTPIELHVAGEFPAYTEGVLFRTGLGPRTVDTKHGTFHVNHWFDNFSQVHRFQLHASEAGQPLKVTYNSRLTSDGIIDKIKRDGRLDAFTFASKYDPCKSFFKKMQSVFQTPPPSAPNEVNIGVTLSANFPGLSKTAGPTKHIYNNSGLETLAARTDAPHFQMLDPQTLEPIGLAKQEVLHPELKGVGSGAHAEHDPATGDIFNYNLDFGRQGTYKIWRTSTSTAETSILATFQHASAYLHSMFMTENFVILAIFNSFYTAGGATILWKRNLLEAMSFDDSRPCTWFVVDRRPPEAGGKGLIATYESEAMFCFHTINAYEETAPDGKVDILADLAGYDNMDILDKFYYNNLVSDAPNAAKWSDASNDAARPTYRRYRLAKIPTTAITKPLKAQCEYKSPIKDTPELPVVAPSVVARKHRYIYGINDTGKSSFADSLIKYDVETHTAKRWSRHGHTPGEAIFVPDPNGNEEDDGVLLTVVLDGFEGRSYLLCLDAKDFAEIARAHTNGVVGVAFHGLYVGAHQKQSIPAAPHL